MSTKLPLSGLLRLVLSLAAVLAGTASAAISRGEESLPRRPFMGAQFTPVSEAERAFLPEHEGVRIVRVFPGSSALEAGLQADDVVLRLDSEPVDSTQAVVHLIARHHVGDELSVELLREGERRALTLTLRPFPEERYEGIEVRYDHVKTDAGLLRSIVTRPAGAAGRAPSVYILQGYDCGSIDVPFAPDSDLARLVRHFSSLGFATYRVEKGGVGDSRGEPCS